MQQQTIYQNIFEPIAKGENQNTFLEDICKKYPYFGVAQYFLLKQTENNQPDYERIAAKTALHFNNLYLLEKRLNEKDEAAIVLTESSEESVQDHQSHEENNTREILIEKTAELENVETVSNEIIEKEPVNSITTEVKTTEPKEEGLLFEPLHTTDYFASQGIRISDDVQSSDKLGRQLKSFTEWLKTMKKVHESKLPAGSDQIDASVNKLAEKSNIDTEIVTEAMAEAYIVQNKPEKAKDIYLKLSLLNPSKNTYFAAKIDQIVW